MAAKKIGIVMACDGEKEFTQSVTSIRKESAALKSEMKNLSAEYDGAANSLDFLDKKQKLLIKTQGTYQRKLSTARDGLNKATSTFQKQAVRLHDLQSALEETRQELIRLESANEQETDDYKKKEKAVSDLEAAIKRQELAQIRQLGSIADWNKKISESETEIKKTNKQIDANEKLMREAEEATDKCAKSIDGYGKKVKDATEVTIGYGKKVKDATEVTIGFGDSVIAGLGGAVGKKGLELLGNAVDAAKETMVDTSKASAQLAASTGLSEAAAKRYDAVMRKIKGGNFGEDYQDIASSMSEVIQIMGELDDSAMQDVTESAITLRDTFGMDVNESIRAADVMIKTMGVDAETAFNLIAKGAQNGLNRSDELTDNLTEYGQLWGQAGFSAQEMFGILENGLDAGAYNLDKVNDFVKEFGVSLSDGRIEKNIGSFSKESQDLFQSWKDGEASTSKVFYSIITDLENMTNEQEALTIASTVWSALGEDNSMQVLKALNDVNDGYREVQGTMDQLKETKFSDLESAVGRLGSALQERIVTPIADAVTPALTGLANFAADLISPAEEVKTGWQELADELESANAGLTDAAGKRDAAVGNAEMEALKLDYLGQRLIVLNGIEEKSAAQKAELNRIVGQLGKSIPELAAAYDAEAGKVNMSDTAIRNYIASQKEAAIVQATLAANQELINSLVEAQTQYDAASERADSLREQQSVYESQIQTISDLENKLAEGTITSDEYQQSLMAIAMQYDDMLQSGEIALSTLPADLQKMLQQTKEDLSIVEKEQEGFGKTIEDGTEKINQNSQSAKKLADSLEDVGDASKDAGIALKENGEASKKGAAALVEEEDAAAALGLSLSGTVRETQSMIDASNDLSDAVAESSESMAAAAEAGADAQKAAMRSIQESYDSTVQSIEADLQNKISLADKFDGGEDLTTEKINENLKNQVEGIRNYQENIEKVRAMADENGKAMFSPELMSAIEAQGMDLANVLDHMVYTWENQGEYGFDQIKNIAEQWAEALDMTEGIAKAEAANKVAMDALAGELGSTEFEFDDLSDAIDSAVESAAESWKALPEETRVELEQAVQTARDCGLKIPEGLTEGIQNGEVSPEEAIAQLNGALQGSFDGVVQIAREQGIKIPESISDGIADGRQATVDEYMQMLSLLSAQGGEARAVGEAAGSEAAGGMQSSITDGTAGVEQASGDMASAGAAAADEKKTEYQTAGRDAAMSYAAGVLSGSQTAVQSAADMARQALNRATAFRAEFRDAGRNMSAGVAEGIRAGQSMVINAAIDMARSALHAAKREADINSPSKKFRREFGQQVSIGAAFGISDKASLAGKAASKMSNKVYTSAVSWLAKYKKRQQVSLEDEKYYWQQVSKHLKTGTSAYEKAVKKIQGITAAELTATGISSGVATKISKNFGVSKTTGSGRSKKKKDAETYYSDIYQAAQKYLSNQQALNDWSLQQELAYWTAVQTQLKKGTQGWYDAQKQIKNLQENIAEAEAKVAEDERKAAEERVKVHANVQDSILNKYKVYYKVSAKAEADYWNVARKQFAVGTEERIDADQKYLEALQEFYDQRKELDEDYADSSREINEKLKDDVQELQDTYKDAVQSRKDDILSQMNLFEAWDSEGYDADTLLYNLKTQVAGLTLWEQQLEELGKKGLSSDLMDELKAMGPDAAASIYSLNQMTAEQLDEYQKLWQQKNALAQSQAVKDNEELRQETNKQITDIRMEAQSELNALNADYRAALAELNQGISGELAGLVSKAGSIGEDAVSGLIGSIGRAADSVETYNSTQKLVTTVSGQLTALQQEGSVIGKNTLDGLLASLTDETKINTASRKVIQSIKRAMEDEAEIHSPSRLFRRETGPQIPTGVAEGIEDGTERAAQSSKKMIRSMLYSTQVELERQQGALQAQAANLNYSGIARLNRMTEQYAVPAPVVNIDNSGVTAALQQTLSGINAIVGRMERLQVVMYPDALIGEIREGLDKANADVAIIKNRRRW